VDHVDQNVRAALDKVRNELKDSQQLLGSTRQQLATYMAKALQPWPTPKAAPSEEIWFVAAFADVSVDMVRAMAKALCREGNRVVALAVATAEGMHVVCSRSEGSQTDCGALVRSITSDGRGGGGGRPHHAEGRLKQQHDWPSLVQAATQP
jgi:alanyl-tRNA synthetase